MAETTVTEQQLAMVLQASRDFAFEQMSRGDRLIPFSARAKTVGDIEFIRFADPESEMPLDEIYTGTQQAVANEVAQGDVLAASLVAGVQLGEAVSGFEQAIRIHIEAQNYCRQVLVPYAIAVPAYADEKGQLSLGEMVAYEAEPVLFTQ